MTESIKVGSSGTGRKKWKEKGFKPRKGGNKTNLSGNKRKCAGIRIASVVGSLVTLLQR